MLLRAFEDLGEVPSGIQKTASDIELAIVPSGALQDVLDECGVDRDGRAADVEQLTDGRHGELGL
jgi:hypothetical protein